MADEVVEDFLVVVKEELELELELELVFGGFKDLKEGSHKTVKTSCSPSRRIQAPLS